MTYGAVEYGGGPYAAPRGAATPAATPGTFPALAVEIAFTTAALSATPAWVDVTADVRSWDTSRGRTRELERFQPGRATVVLGNRSRQYDSVNAAGPWYGYIKPMRRIRIRETYAGVTYPVFDGFVDRWQLDYPAVGKDATATVTATDGFKVMIRTTQPESVYQQTVAADTPSIWWRLSDPPDSSSAVSWGSLANMNGTYRAPLLGRPGLTFGQPGSALETVNDTVSPGTLASGMELPDSAGFTLVTGNWSVECWARIGRELTGGFLWHQARLPASALTSAMVVFLTDANNTRQFVFFMQNDAGTIFAVESPTFNPADRVHVVAKVQNSNMSLWVNGVEYTTVSTDNGGTGRTISGVFSNDAFTIGHRRTSPGGGNWVGIIDEFAVYQHASADPLSDTRIAAHYTDGTSPWQGDQVSTRIGRLLDAIAWPADLRDLDATNATLQSATLHDDALAHAQKATESEFGAFYMSRMGAARLASRANIFARTAQPEIYGDGAGEIGYRDITFDDGDQVLRNRATITRLDGIAKTAEDTVSEAEYGRFDYALSGLLHQSDSHSASYAAFIVAEYAAPRRRVTTLMLGPAASGKEATLYPLMLGREIGDSITVRRRPPGGGATFEQVCVIEGVAHTGSHEPIRTTTWMLSPEIAGSF